MIPNPILRTFLYGLVFIWSFIDVAVADAADTLAFSAHHESVSARIHFNGEQQELADRIGEVFDFARNAVGPRYGRVPTKILVYIYGSNEALAEGVRQSLGYSEKEAAAAVRVGVTEVKKGTFHAHRRIANWDDAIWHVLVDEYVHGVTEARFGATPAQSATWIDEGLTSYLAHHALKEKIPEFETRYLDWTQRTAFKALVFGQLPRLREISERQQWVSNINRSPEAWRNEYAAADAAVFYIIENYGMGAVEAILAAVGKGMHYTEALRTILGVSIEELESDVRLSIAWAGLFHRYPKYTAAFLVLSLFLPFLIKWSLNQRKKSAANKAGIKL